MGPQTTWRRPAHGRPKQLGDRILFTKYSGTEVKLDGEEHLIIREEDILGVIDGR